MAQIRVVWHEGKDARCIIGRLDGEDDGFLTFILSDGRTVKLNRQQITKMEEVRS